MPRVSCARSSEEKAPGSALASSIGEPTARRPRNKHTKSAIKKRIDAALVEHDAAVIKKSRPGEPRHLVASYVKCHELVYGVKPAELYEPKEWLGACSAAKRLLDDAFGGSFDAAGAFSKWLWAREAKRHEERREQGRETTRIVWRAQFVWKNLLTDYRAATARGRR